jgi:hypothetical protein
MEVLAAVEVLAAMNVLPIMEVMAEPAELLRVRMVEQGVIKEMTEILEETAPMGRMELLDLLGLLEAMVHPERTPPVFGNPGFRQQTVLTVAAVRVAVVVAAAVDKSVTCAIMVQVMEEQAAEVAVRAVRAEPVVMAEEALLGFSSMLTDKEETSWIVLFNRVLLGLEV